MCDCRDIKPQNILLQNGKPGGQVYLVDFGGVQAAAASQGSMPFASTIIGTYGYMAPEQFQGSASHASDLYSLGGTLLYLLTGPLCTISKGSRGSIAQGLSKLDCRSA